MDNATRRKHSIKDFIFLRMMFDKMLHDKVLAKDQAFLDGYIADMDEFEKSLYTQENLKIDDYLLAEYMGSEAETNYRIQRGDYIFGF